WISASSRAWFRKHDSSTKRARSPQRLRPARPRRLERRKGSSMPGGRERWRRKWSWKRAPSPTPPAVRTRSRVLPRSSPSGPRGSVAYDARPPPTTTAAAPRPQHGRASASPPAAADDHNVLGHVGRQGTTKLQDSEARPTLGHDGGDAKPLRTQRLTAISCPRAKVAELADAQDSGSCGLNTRGGSSPPFRTFLVE